MLLLFGRSIGGQQFLIKDALGVETSRELIPMVRRAVSFSLLIEAIGAVIMFFVFIKDYPPLVALGFGIFHAISAYNNASIDLIGNSMENYVDNIPINLTITTLIILGGIGFFVYNDILGRKKRHRLSTHSKIVITVTASLIIFGTIIFHFAGNLPWMASYFQSVTSRTAGFDTVPSASLNNSARFLTIILMFIGACPGSTGGGIKTTTFLTILLTILSLPRGKHPTVFRRKIAEESITKAFVVFGAALTLIVLSTFVLISIEAENGLEDLDLMFEAVSAFATV